MEVRYYRDPETGLPHIPDEEGDGVFVVTACPLAGKQLKAFRRRKRRRAR